MPPFNIALFPESKQFIDNCVKFAQENFSTQAEEYLLGDNAWPHITLCQFQAEPEHIDEVWSTVINLTTEPLSIPFSHFYILPHADKHWVGLAAAREPLLIALQLAVYEKLNTLGIKSEQPHSVYVPHLTWARCSGEKPPSLTILPDKEFWSKSYPFSLSLGQSDKHGVYRKRLRGYT